jgi:hypothetical protein
VLVAGGCAMLVAAVSQGQGNARKGKPATPSQLKSMDAEAQKLIDSYAAGLQDLAQSYEDAGQVERAKAMLDALLKVDPENERAKAKLKEFSEAVFAANELEIDVDAANAWTATNISVMKEKPVRFAASGTYKFIVNETLGPDGFPTTDVVRDMADAPLGALVGVVVPPQALPGGRADAQQKLPGRPFLIGSEKEYTPTEDGVVYVKLNVPPASKCSGKVRVTISGNLRRAGN